MKVIKFASSFHSYCFRLFEFLRVMIWKKVVLILLLLGIGGCSQRRAKRVIDGEILKDRTTAYKVIRYYAAIATAHGIPWYTFGFWEFLKDFGVYGSVLCSGVLLAPMILQTACHCVAEFDLNSGRFPKPPFVKNYWEYARFVYVGVSHQYCKESMMTYRPIITERFMLHSKCGRFGKNKSATYDYALIRLDSEWIKADGPKTYPWTEIEWAPHYTAKEITDFHYYALQKQQVCLHIGFGSYERGSTLQSDDLRHGWGMLLTHAKCVYKTSIFNEWEEVNKYHSWVCVGKFSFHDQEVGKGDSGGPVTCNNRLFAIVSGYRYGNLGQEIEHLSLDSALFHNLHVNAIEYRDALIHLMYINETKYKDMGRTVEAKKLIDSHEQYTELHQLASRAIHGSFSSPILFLLCILLLIV